MEAALSLPLTEEDQTAASRCPAFSPLTPSVSSVCTGLAARLPPLPPLFFMLRGHSPQFTDYIAPSGWRLVTVEWHGIHRGLQVVGELGINPNGKTNRNRISPQGGAAPRTSSTQAGVALGPRTTSYHRRRGQMWTDTDRAVFSFVLTQRENVRFPARGL